ncbi:MAG: Trypanothione synthetase protein [uncultured bacterium]|nr:MAG: Trypanothione synthetase protein [uncultured bacterium]HBD05388.1 hypothetical protein [Candidatus Uhrbacteria bacterium]
MRKFRAVISFVGLLLVAGAIALYIPFCTEVSRADKEWEAKFPKTPRTPEERRALLESLYTYRHDTIPAFVPLHGWDNEYCALNVENAINFILGEKKIKDAAAWKFGEVNSETVRLVYERGDDFEIKGNQIIEVRDRTFWLSNVLETVGHEDQLTSDRMYVVGYHYKRTRHDSEIIENGGSLNSHLMLIVGRYNGSWWGYHMFHHPSVTDENPFRVDAISKTRNAWDMPDDFDLVYIWEVNGTEMPRDGADLRLVSNSPDWQQVAKTVGQFGTGKLDKLKDNIKLFWLGNGDNYPSVEKTEGLVETKPRTYRAQFQGELLGLWNGVAVRGKGRYNRRGVFGLEYECVEFANRYYTTKLGHNNMTKTGNADSYFYSAKKKGLNPNKNGCELPPERNDLIVFDPEGHEDDDPGHVAVVTERTENEVCFVAQSAVPWFNCLPIAQTKSGGWHVVPLSDKLTTVGWLRP